MDKITKKLTELPLEKNKPENVIWEHNFKNAGIRG
jgi:hypothetical protein